MKTTSHLPPHTRSARLSQEVPAGAELEAGPVTQHGSETLVTIRCTWKGLAAYFYPTVCTLEELHAGDRVFVEGTDGCWSEAIVAPYDYDHALE